MKNYLAYITADFVRLAAVTKNHKPGIIIREYETPLSPIGGVEEVSRSLKNLARENKVFAEHLILGIPRSQISMRHLSFPSHSDGEIRRMVHYELANLFPYKPEELVYDYSVIQKEADGSSRVLLAAAQKEAVLAHINLMRLAGLTVDAIEISTASLFNQLIEQKKHSQSCLLVYMDNGYLDLLQVNNQKLVFSRGIRCKMGDAAGCALKAVAETIAVNQDKGEEPVQKIILAGRQSGADRLIQGMKSLSACPVETEESITLSGGFLQHKNFHSLRLNLLPQEYRAQKEKQAGKKRVVLFALLLLFNALLAGNIIFFRLKNSRQYLKELNDRIKTLDSQTADAQNTVRKIQLMRDYHSDSALALGILSQLYGAATESIRITQLEISQRKQANGILIAGQASDSEAVLQFANNLKAGAVIKKTEISYIAKKGLSAENKVNFEIKASF